MKNKNLIFARKAAGLTQEGLAGKLNVTPRSVNSWENGGEISVDHLIELYETFNRKYSMDFLLGYSDYTQIGNEEMHDLTGLSDKAINELRYLKSATNEPVDEISKSKLEALNLILENHNDLLLSLWDFIFAEYLPKGKALTAKRENGTSFQMSNGTLQKTALLDIVNTAYYLKSKVLSADNEPQKEQKAEGFHLDLTSFELLDNSLSGTEKRLI
jgi:transcriptional regulator with XRE-family HTH domain